MRNILVHAYFGIDKQPVWAVVESDLPDLKEQLDVLLKQLCEESFAVGFI